MNFIELFCGKGIVTRIFNAGGFSTWSTDIRKRKGICEPDLQIDALKLKREMIPFPRIDVIWASIPCTAFSYGAGNRYYDKRMPKETAGEFLHLLEKSLALIEECLHRDTFFRSGDIFQAQQLDRIGEGRPDTFYFIENPRGKLRYEKALIDFLARTNGVIKEITMGSYGFPTTKPTDIFTNAHGWKPRERLPYGRGAKNPLHSLDRLTLCSKQETPEQLAQDVFQFVVNARTEKSAIDFSHLNHNTWNHFTTPLSASGTAGR